MIYTETWAQLFANDGFTITTDELTLVKALREDSEYDPTEWFDLQQA